MRKIVSLLLALCLVVGMVPVVASAVETSLPEPNNGVITLKEFLTDGNTAVTDSNGNYIVEGFTPQNAVAKIGDEYYRSLNDAFNAVEATNKTTIEILKDVVLDSSDKQVSLMNENVVLDLGNHHISASETYSAGKFIVVGSGSQPYYSRSRGC